MQRQIKARKWQNGFTVEKNQNRYYNDGSKKRQEAGRKI
jgi:hypothetical protein